jgi:hypothetical protein
MAIAKSELFTPVCVDVVSAVARLKPGIRALKSIDRSDEPRVRLFHSIPTALSEGPEKTRRPQVERL